MKKPNVLILMTDSQRYDTVHAAGYDYMITPNLDRIAKEGVLYHCAVSSNPQCMPARIDLLTGLTGKYHGYYLNSHEPIKDYAIPTIPRIFSENGYRTAGVGKMHFRPERTHHGYDHIEFMEDIPVCKPNDDYCMWLAENGQGHIQNVQGVRTFLYNLPQESLMAEEYHPNTYVATRSIDWLEKNGEEPFFLMCSWTQPHPPLMIPEYYRKMYEDKELPAPLPIQNGKGEYLDKDGEDIRHNREIRKSYYGSITMIDKNIGRILDWLEKNRKLDNTLIIFTSDHGEMLGDCGSWFKDWPYEGSVRIPFIIKYPGGEKKGVSYDYIDHLDLFPTCLDVCGLSYNSDKYVLQGHSLLEERNREIHVFAHGTLDGYFLRYVCASDKRYKYIYTYDGYEELYDLETDAAEIINLIGTDKVSQNVIERLRLAADAYEQVNFPGEDYNPGKTIFAAKGEKPKMRPQMSKYWDVFHYYRFWLETPEARQETFTREFYEVLKNSDKTAVFSKIKKLYQARPEGVLKEMKQAWEEFCGKSDIWLELEKALENDIMK